jgi:hypothetical protein
VKIATAMSIVGRRQSNGRIIVGPKGSSSPSRPDITPKRAAIASIVWLIDKMMDNAFGLE